MIDLPIYRSTFDIPIGFMRRLGWVRFNGFNRMLPIGHPEPTQEQDVADLGALARDLGLSVPELVDGDSRLIALGLVDLMMRVNAAVVLLAAGETSEHSEALVRRWVEAGGDTPIIAETATLLLRPEELGGATGGQS